MTAVLLHIRFPYEGPWSDAMSQAYASLADDIATEPGLRWKLWLEEAAQSRAGGAYLFEDRASAERYLTKHRARLAQWGIVDLEVTLSDVNDALSQRSRAATGPAQPPMPPFTTWAEVSIDAFPQFLQVFSDAGLQARRRHGSLSAQVFRVPGNEQTARVLIDWQDRASFDAFIADPQVKATMRSGGATRPPEFTFVERAGQFHA